MKLIPIRTKILVTLLGLTLGGLGAALLTARNLFEHDKAAYLFDVNQETAETKSIMVNSILQQWLQAISPLGLSLDLTQGNLGAAGQILFQNFKDLQTVLILQGQQEPFTEAIRQSKNPDQNQLERVRQDLIQAIQTQSSWPLIRINQSLREVQIITKIQAQNQTGQARHYYAIYVLDAGRMTSLFSSAAETQHLLLNSELQVQLGMDKETDKLWQEILQTTKFSGLHNLSQLIKVPSGEFLVSFAKLSDYDYYVVSITPEAVISRVLRDLSMRMLYVSLFVGFIVLGVSVLISKNLTANIEQLMQAVGQISKGNFDLKLKIRSRDETGLLARGFEKMSGEIHRLLHETAEKSRMESELKTAQTVQATLFPEPVANFRDFQIAGYYRSASECGGDWWFYKQSGDELFIMIADATGHGAAAALITSAARSIFSMVGDREGESAVSVARLLNRAVFETSKGNLLMTALVIRLNLKTGLGEVVNCSHESIFQLPPGPDGRPVCVLPRMNPRLGQQLNVDFQPEEIIVHPGQTICLYTDGLPDVRSPEGKSYGERRFLKALARSEGTAEEGVHALVAELEKFNGGTELIDDVTLVLLSRSGPDEVRETALKS